MIKEKLKTCFNCKHFSPEDKSCALCWGSGKMWEDDMQDIKDVGVVDRFIKHILKSIVKYMDNHFSTACWNLLWNLEKKNRGKKDVYPTKKQIFVTQ